MSYYKSIKCEDCGNDEHFLRTAKATEAWFCDSKGNLMEVIESYDFKPQDDLKCADCGSRNLIKEVI